MGVKAAPVFAIAIDEPPPIHPVAGGEDDVRDVRAIEALALHDQALGPDHLLGRDEPHLDVEDDALDRVIEPELIDGRHAVAGAEDEIDEVFAFERFPQPVRKGQLALVSRRIEDRLRLWEILPEDEDIEVFRVALDPRVAREGIRAADEKRQAAIPHQLHRIDVERAALRIDEGVRGRGKYRHRIGGKVHGACRSEQRQRQP